MLAFLYALLILARSASAAGVVGTAYGFASGVTGGGTATTVTPANNAQLQTYLSDSTPRVIVLTKTFNFKGTSVTTTGCRPTASCSGGQDTIKSSCDSNETPVQVVYDAAGITGLSVGSQKTLVGVGTSGALQGKGLRILSGSKNVIVQNVRITDINPKYVWGGDGISPEGNDGVWIDHCTFDNIGRMFAVSHYTANRATLSWNLFNGVTSYSTSCNGDQYWGTMFVGSGDKISLDRNYYHDMSGRSPKVGGGGTTVLLHATNNVWNYNSGHAFDVGSGGYALIEGNRFLATLTPITSDSASSGGYVFDVPDSTAAATCASYFGRSCVVNALTNSGTWISLTSTAVLSQLSAYKSYLVTPVPVSDILGTVTGNAGVGHV